MRVRAGVCVRLRACACVCVRLRAWGKHTRKDTDTRHTQTHRHTRHTPTRHTRSTPRRRRDSHVEKVILGGRRKEKENWGEVKLGEFVLWTERHEMGCLDALFTPTHTRSAQLRSHVLRLSLSSLAHPLSTPQHPPRPRRRPTRHRPPRSPSRAPRDPRAPPRTRPPPFPRPRTNGRRRASST